MDSTEVQNKPSAEDLPKESVKSGSETVNGGKPVEPVNSGKVTKTLSAESKAEMEKKSEKIPNGQEDDKADNDGTLEELPKKKDTDGSPKKIAQNAAKDLKNLWFTNLSDKTKATDLKSLLSKYDKVVNVKIVASTKGQKIAHYGFVVMTTGEGASAALKNLNNTEVHGQVVTVQKTDKDITALCRKPGAPKSPVAKSECPKKDEKVEEKNAEKEATAAENSGKQEKKVEPKSDQLEEVVEEINEEVKPDDTGKKKEEEPKKTGSIDEKDRKSKPQAGKHFRDRSRERRHPRSGSRSRPGRDLRPMANRRARDMAGRHIPPRRPFRDSARERLRAERRYIESRRRRSPERRDSRRLEREWDSVRMEKEHLEYERLKLEREKQQIEREKLEREKAELRRQVEFESMDERRGVKRAFDMHGEVDFWHENKEIDSRDIGLPSSFNEFDRSSYRKDTDKFSNRSRSEKTSGGRREGRAVSDSRSGRNEASPRQRGRGAGNARGGMSHRPDPWKHAPEEEPNRFVAGPNPPPSQWGPINKDGWESMEAAPPPPKHWAPIHGPPRMNMPHPVNMPPVHPGMMNIPGNFRFPMGNPMMRPF